MSGGLLSTAFVSCLIGSLAMGLSCGTGCSPVISLFLSSYVVRCKGETKASLISFARFFIGKGSAVMAVCTAASLTGRAIINGSGYLGKGSLGILMPVFLIATGLYMLFELYRSAKQGGRCQSCHGHDCGSGNTKESRLLNAAPLLGGFIYGLTPCAPLVILAGYALTMSLGQALILALLFSLVSAVSPLLLMVLFMKLVVSKMRTEVPRLLTGLRWALSLAVVAMGGYLFVMILTGNAVSIIA